jgi:hypothetical protein
MRLRFGGAMEILSLRWAQMRVRLYPGLSPRANIRHTFGVKVKDVLRVNFRK